MPFRRTQTEGNGRSPNAIRVPTLLIMRFLRWRPFGRCLLGPGALRFFRNSGAQEATANPSRRHSTSKKPALPWPWSNVAATLEVANAIGNQRARSPGCGFPDDPASDGGQVGYAYRPKEFYPQRPRVKCWFGRQLRRGLHSDLTKSKGELAGQYIHQQPQLMQIELRPSWQMGPRDAGQARPLIAR
jgi:hypothetical protein